MSRPSKNEDLHAQVSDDQDALYAPQRLPAAPEELRNAFTAQRGSRAAPADAYLRFERLLTELSAAFVNLPPDQVDAQIEATQRRLVEFLDVDRCSFGEFANENKELRVTHSYVVPGLPPFPRIRIDELFPWYIERIRQGEILCFERLPDDLPSGAGLEKDFCLQTGFKSHLAIPLKVGGSLLCVLTFGSLSDFRPWPDELIQRLRLVGEILANAVARKQAEADLRTAHARQQDLTSRLLHAQEEERRRIAREMHDDWTQRLTLLGIDIVKLEKLLGAPAKALALLRTMQEQLVSLSEDVHDLSRQLHPAILDDLGLVEALRSECAGFSRREGISVDYRPENVPSFLPKDIGLCVYRVAQEALRNIAKHAAVKEARVCLGAAGSELVLRVLDKGAGFDSAAAHTQAGLGLSSIAERVRLVHGELSITSAQGHGTTVAVHIPLAGSTS